MLKIFFGRLEGALDYPSRSFENMYKQEWFDDEFVKHICKVVDNTDVVSAYQMSNPVFGPVNYRILSTGCKNCILAYKTDYIIDATKMGDNCATIINEIGKKKKDLTVMLEYTMNFSNVKDIEALIINTGKVVHSYSEYLDEVCKIEW